PPLGRLKPCFCWGRLSAKCLSSVWPIARSRITVRALSPQRSPRMAVAAPGEQDQAQQSAVSNSEKDMKFHRALLVTALVAVSLAAVDAQAQRRGGGGGGTGGARAGGWSGGG